MSFLSLIQQYQPLLAIFLGVGLHLGYFWRNEHHLHGVKYVQTFIILFVSMISAIVAFGNEISLISSLAITTWFFSYVFLGLYGSLLSYRLLWHPLRKFPGPIAAPISSLWLTTQVTNSDAHKKALELYNEYGPFVRVGSNDLMIAHPSAVPVVHGAKSKCLRASWYDEDGDRQSLHMSRNPQFHHHRRGMWSQSFSDKALRGYESRIAVFNKALVDGFAAYNGQPLNAAKWFDYYSYDVMGDLSFSKDFGMLKSGEEHFAIGLLNEAMGLQGLKLPTWLFRMLTAVPGLSGKYWQFIEYCDQQLAAKMAEEKNEKPSVMTVLLDQVGKHPSQHDLLTLQADTRTIIIAGSDTVAATLTHIFYILATYPEHVVKLREELLPLMSSGGGIGNFEHQKIHQAEHLNAVINETFRLYPVPPTTIMRKTPPEGIEVDGRYIPGNMHVWTPQYVIGRSEDAYENPYEFVPERWYSKPSMIKDPSGFAPFLIGPYRCIGRPLALMQLRLVIAECVVRFDIEFPPGKDGSEFIDNVKDRFTWGLADLEICFRPRM